MPGDGKEARSVGHHNVFALAHDPKPCLFKRPNCTEVIHACQFGHGLHLDDNLLHSGGPGQFFDRVEILTDGLGNVG